MKISACMIAKNEEKVIARCIESYRKVVDEIIVVDTGSTDRTVAIAESMGAKVFRFTWNDDFSAAKNFAIDQAKGDWIVFLDADEYFANGTGANLRRYLNKLDKAYNAVVCRMINIDEISGKAIDEITHIRVFKNNKKIRYVRPIHEGLVYHGKGGKLLAHLADKQDLVIHHTGYSANVSKKKARRNLTMLLNQMEDEKTAHPEYWYYIADSYNSLEEYEKVITYIRLFRASGIKMTNLNARVHSILINAMVNLQYPAHEIMEEVDIAIKKFPRHPAFRFYKAKLLYDDKLYEAALHEALKAKELQDTYEDIEINDLSTNLSNLYNLLGTISELKNDTSAAMGYYLEALKLDKYDTLAFDRLLKLIQTQPLGEIIAFLNTVYDLEDEADLDFLATNLVNQAVPRVLAYYTSIREKKYPKEDYVVLQMLVANAHYDKAFAPLLDCYLKDMDERLALVIATAAFLSDNANYISLAIENLPPEYGNILKAYQGSNIKFDENDKIAFINMVRTLILWGDDNSKQKLFNLANHFADGIAAIGRQFLEEGDYQSSLFYFNAAIDQALASGRMVHPILFYYQGYCLHRLNNPLVATESFIKAYDAGYRVNDIYEFLRWNMDKLSNSSHLREKSLRVVYRN